MWFDLAKLLVPFRRRIGLIFLEYLVLQPEIIFVDITVLPNDEGGDPLRMLHGQAVSLGF